MYLNPFNKPIEMDKSLLKAVIEPGDSVVDATCGNGYDTVFLAEQVGPNGMVYAFDIQETAISTTRQQLGGAALKDDRVTLIQDSHASMDQYLNEPVKAIMFNLGYLPGSDKQIVTQPDSTIKGIALSLELLTTGGLLTIVLYQGHETGKLEAMEVEAYLSQLNQEQYSVRKINPINYLNDPPYLIAVLKL